MQPPGPPFATVPGSRTTVRMSPELAARLSARTPATVVGQLPLPPPLSRLVVLARSRAGLVSLAAALIPTATRGALAVTPLGIVKQLGAIQPPKLVSQVFRTRQQADVLFVQDDAGQDRYLLAERL